MELRCTLSFPSRHRARMHARRAGSTPARQRPRPHAALDPVANGIRSHGLRSLAARGDAAPCQLFDGSGKHLIHGDREDADLCLRHTLLESAIPTRRLVVEYGVVVAAGEPLARLRTRRENRDARHAHCRRQVHRPAVVADHHHGILQHRRTHARRGQAAEVRLRPAPDFHEPLGSLALLAHTEQHEGKAGIFHSKTPHKSHPVVLLPILCRHLRASADREEFRCDPVPAEQAFRFRDFLMGQPEIPRERITGVNFPEHREGLQGARRPGRVEIRPRHRQAAQRGSRERNAEHMRNPARAEKEIIAHARHQSALGRCHVHEAVVCALLQRFSQPYEPVEIPHRDRIPQHIIVKARTPEDRLHRRSLRMDGDIRQQRDVRIWKCLPDKMECRQHDQRIAKAAKPVHDHALELAERAAHRNVG